MRRCKVSISIPYKQRLDNLNLVFEALSDQTMNKDEFEVIVGAMEYCNDFVKLCTKYNEKINIISVLSAADFSIPRARNLAMRQATGEIIVQMDADTLLPNNALENLYDRHFAFGQRICVVGQVVGYGNNNDGDVEGVEVLPYSKYSAALDELTNAKGTPMDPRFQVKHMVPWAFGWTGFIALPLKVIHEKDLYFDESFHGWGVDDLEWSFRICNSKIPIVLCEDIRAIHLPHTRDQKANQKTEKRNYGRFLRKWPRLDVELAYVFGDVNANSMFFNFLKEINHAFDGKYTPGVVRGNINGNQILIVGAMLNEKQELVDTKIAYEFDVDNYEILPLLGMALPFDDKQIDQVRVMPVIHRIADKYQDAINAEISRVAKEVV